MPKHILRYAMIIVIEGVLSSVFQPTSYLTALTQQPECTTFRETGKTVCGRFLAYWREHGGLAQYGYPISKEFVEASQLSGKFYTVQYFERAVFELHPENQPPYDVLLSQLGTFQFKHRYPEGDAKLPTTEPDQNKLMYPKSPRVEIGKPYAISIYTHCGIDTYLDFDGSFWNALEPAHRNAANPPLGVGNPGQNGNMTLVDENHARFEFDNRVFYFHRHIGPKMDRGCF